MSLMKDIRSSKMKKTYEKIVRDSASIARIDVESSTISVLYEYDRTFIKTVKALGYSWHKPFWQLNIDSEIYGNLEDRIVELGVSLLDNRINIEVSNKEILNKIENNNFKPRKWYWLILNNCDLKLVSYKQGRFSTSFLYDKYSHKEILGKWNNKRYSLRSI